MGPLKTEGRLESAPEIGEPVDVVFGGTVAIRCTWLGRVDGDDWTLTDACQLMTKIGEEDER